MKDLLGDPIPEPLPSNKHLRWDELIGHTIRAVIEDPAGQRQTDVLIITETNCFLSISAEVVDEDEATISTGHYSYGSPSLRTLSEFASAQELWDVSAINGGEYQVLKEAEERRKSEQKAKEIQLAEERLARLKALVM
jgi:hypothetical protein